MKELIISTRRQKTELKTLLVCFIIANLVNLIAIIVYDASLLELITSIGYVAVFTLVIYVAWTAIRGACYGIRQLLRKK